MRKTLALLLSLMMIMTVVPGIALAIQKGYSIDEALNVKGGEIAFEADGFEVREEDGRVFAVSTNHDDSSSATLSCSVTVEANDVVVFEVKCDSEYIFDELYCYVGENYVGDWSGQTEWEENYYVFSEAGTYDITWTYKKDESDYIGDDIAMIDNVYVGENNFEIDSIEVTDELYIAVDGEKSISVKRIPEYAEVNSISFGSLDETIATVDENGIVKGIKTGMTKISVTVNDAITKTTMVNVCEPVIGTAYSLSGDESGFGDLEMIQGEMQSELHNIDVEGFDGVASAEYFDGKIYAYAVVESDTEETSVLYLVIDAETYAVLSSKEVADFPNDMTYDYTTKTMYAVIDSASNGEVSELVKVDLETGAMKAVKTLDFYAMTCAAYDGLIYMISYEDADLLCYDIINDCLDKLFNVGIEPNYIQSMSFDYATGNLYWLGYNDSIGGFIALIEPNGEVRVLNELADSQFTTLWFETNDPSFVPVEGIELDKTEIEIMWGETAELTATILPADASNQYIQWATNDTSVVIVNDGILTPTGDGTATITAKTISGKKVAICDVTVKGAPVYKLYESFEDESTYSEWTNLDEDGDMFAWNIESSFVKKIYDGEGVACSYSYDNWSEEPLTPDNWLISPAFNVDAGDELSWFAIGQDEDYAEENYSVYVLDADYEELEDADQIFTGTSSDEWQNEKVDLTEYVGKDIRIAFRHHNITDMFSINIDLVTVETDAVNVDVTGIELSEEEISMFMRDEKTIEVTFTPENATNKRIRWESSDESVVTVEDGVLTPIGSGEAIITAVSVNGAFTKMCSITVIGDEKTILYEDFEDELEGWTMLDEDGDEYTWDLWTKGEGMIPYEGNGVMSSFSYDLDSDKPLTPDNWLISPAFEVDAYSALSWYVYGQDEDYYDEHYAVYVLPEDYELDQAVMIYEGISTYEWLEQEVSLAAFAGQRVRIAFRHYDSVDIFSLSIDLIQVTTIEFDGLTGDVNNDNAINTGDAVVVLKYAADMEELTPAQLKRADYNGDGLNNTGDAVAILVRCVR